MCGLQIITHIYDPNPIIVLFVNVKQHRNEFNFIWDVLGRRMKKLMLEI